jgi:hypothetical protein
MLICSFPALMGNGFTVLAQISQGLYTEVCTAGIVPCGVRQRLTCGPGSLIAHIPQRRTKCRKEHCHNRPGRILCFAVARLGFTSRLFFLIPGGALSDRVICPDIQEEKLFAHFFFQV